MHTVKNITKGIRGFNEKSGLVEVGPGQEATEADISDAELAVMKRTGWFEITSSTGSGGGGVGDPDKPKKPQTNDLDTTVTELRKIAETENVDLSGLTAKSDIQGAITAARIAKQSGGGDGLDDVDDETLLTTVSAVTGKSADELKDMDRAALLKLARGE